VAVHTGHGLDERAGTRVLRVRIESAASVGPGGRIAAVCAGSFLSPAVLRRRILLYRQTRNALGILTGDAYDRCGVCSTSRNRSSLFRSDTGISHCVSPRNCCSWRKRGLVSRFPEGSPGSCGLIFVAGNGSFGSDPCKHRNGRHPHYCRSVDSSRCKPDRFFRGESFPICALVWAVVDRDLHPRRRMGWRGHQDIGLRKQITVRRGRKQSREPTSHQA